MARKSKATCKQKIALCKMFSGNYWKDSNNIGYESINMFLPDGQAGEDEPESYVYLPADGDYSLKSIEIKYVILTQHIAIKIAKKSRSSIVKVIGMAEVIEETLKEDYKNVEPKDASCKNYKCIGGITEFKNLQEVFSNKKCMEPLYKKAEILNKIHKRQQEKLTVVKYSGIKLEDIFKKNYLFGDLNILVSLKVKNLSIPAKNIYLTNNKENFSNFIQSDDTVIIMDKNPSAQSQTTFIDYNCDIIKTIKDITKWESAKELDISKFKPGFEQSFLTIIKKEYDELSYSNLFAYFLGKLNFFNHFFGTPWDESVEPHKPLIEQTAVKFDVVREEGNIDILIKAEDFIIVIENKIKSALNGHLQEDINGEDFNDQLVRYYEYVKNKYGGKTIYCFVFAPDYNPIDKDSFGASGTIEMKNVWRVIRYSEILKKCDNFNGFKGTSDECYYEEFKKALRVHTISSLTNYYRDMQIRMKNLF